MRQWVLSLPKRLRYHLQHDREALNSALRIVLNAVEQHLHSRCPGAVAFIHRFGSSLNEHTMLLARIDEVFPLTCPRCGAEMRIIAFMTEAVDVRAILEHIGEPATAPRIASARGPPEWYEDSVEDAIDAEARFSGDPLAQPEPEYEYDQRVSW